jgi:hypothetical protein
MVSRPDSRILDLLNVRLLLSMTPVPDNPKFVKAADLPGRLAYENQSPLPRFFLVLNVKRAEDMSDAVRQLGSPEFDPAKNAVVEQGTAEHYPEAASGAVNITKYSPTEVKVHVESAAPRYLVTSEVNYPGWRAFLDGHEQPISMTNVAFRGMAVPAGNHEIVFRFRPTILLWSAGVSVLACLALSWLLWHN